MAKSFAALVDEVEVELADTGNATWTAAEVTAQMEKALKEISDSTPYVIRESYRFETRYGTAGSTAASALSDTAKGHFGSGDVGKEVFNLTDRTHARIISFTSTAQVGLSKDIFTINEQYEIYHKDCHNQFQLNLENVTDYVGDKHGVQKIVYPIEAAPEYRRNFHLEGDDQNIMTVDLASTPPYSGSASADVECLVFFNTRQRVSQLTDLSATLSATAAVGATTLAMTALQGAGTIKEGDMFTVADMRGLYRVTADTTIASSASAAVAFWPALDGAIASTATVITFVKSTLSPDIERIAVDLTSGICMMTGAGAPSNINSIMIGGPAVAARYYQMGTERMERARRELRARIKPKTSQTYSNT